MKNIERRVTQEDPNCDPVEEDAIHAWTKHQESIQIARHNLFEWRVVCKFVETKNWINFRKWDCQSECGSSREWEPISPIKRSVVPILSLVLILEISRNQKERQFLHRQRIVVVSTNWIILHWKERRCWYFFVKLPKYWGGRLTWQEEFDWVMK